ncbi:MAG TPA: radical SAM protein [Burkholderiales bacterium]|nr:radical SAM protein [Burkholderiales bacterium]
MPTARVFELFLIKPSHYDDEGYVIQWMVSSIPANTLATLNGLAMDCAARHILGTDVEIRITAWDETNTRIRPDLIARRIRDAGAGGLVALVGVQTNQYPRAMDLARQLRALDLQVCMGGFHVSGTIAMLPETPPELKEAMAIGVSLFAGEAEGRLDEILVAAHRHELKPLYNFMKDLPDLENQPTPFLPLEAVKRTSGVRTSFDAGRGCPFLCSFCTIINVQGRKSRSRNADDVERLIRANLKQGVRSFFITDDNLARNSNWEPIFDRLAEMREKEGLNIRIIAQVDTAAHKIRGFIEKAARAGVNRVFIGLENINPESLKDAHKGQNRITEYRTMLQAWHNVGTLVYAGYIVGFPNDTPETIERDIRIIQNELPIDLLEFFILTPLPGSADHKKLHLSGVPMSADLNKYDLVHVTTGHGAMSEAELFGIYQKAWDIYYSDEHFERVIRRTKAWSFPHREMMMKLFTFYACYKVEGVHPLEGGYMRRKYRRDRRPSMKRENPLVFYPKYAWEIIAKHAKLLRMYAHYSRMLKRVLADDTPHRDIAMEPVREEEFEALEMYTHTQAARDQTGRARKKVAAAVH